MQIQRIQSLYLLLASALMLVVSLWIPVAHISTTDASCVAMYIYDNWTMAVICLFTTVLLFTTIFLYNRLKFQMSLCLWCSVFIWVSAFVCAFILSQRMPNGVDGVTTTVNWLWPSLMMLVAFILSVMAYSNMKKDYNLLRSSERIR